MSKTRPTPEERLRHVVVSPSMSIAYVIPMLDKAGTGVLLVCNDDRLLMGVLTDGDIRRAILKGLSFDAPCIEIASRNPIVAKAPVNQAEALYLMDHGKSFFVNQLPVVDEQGRVLDLLLRRDFITEDTLPVSAVIMAGGFGTRLLPLTEDLPKPLLPVGDRPLMEHTIDQLKRAGIQHVNITTHYLAEKIKEYFGDGHSFGVDIHYVSEDRPLGTAGSLRLMDVPEDPLLVINGDILTRLDFRSMMDFHRKHNADMTVAVRQYSYQVPYGVLEMDGPKVCRVLEKPNYHFLVNAGIYLLQPSVYSYLPDGKRFDMTDLIQVLIAKERTVISFPIMEYWLDIGQRTDYEQAQKDISDGRLA